MASSSSSCNYEVFLNFRGEDTRRIFTCHLYDNLYEKKKVKTFMDDENLGRGDEISDALLNAIQGSKISVVIFSKDYASSKWCLNELVKILECKNTNGQIIIPVFYRVSPSDVRHQTGVFGDGFYKLEQQFKEKPEIVQKWRVALTETTYLAGHESTKFRHDAELVNKIVEDVLKKLEKITVSADSSNGPVGLNSRIEQIKPFLCMDLWDTVHIVGIWGMGGIGKTTLAEAIFDQFSGEFEGRCFFSDVRRNSETGIGLEHLQKQMLSRILSEKLELAGPNIPQFTKERVRRMKVLIVLDDVNKVGQLEDLIGRLDQYGPGSRIVVTTRDKRVLEEFGVEKEKIYGVNGLKRDEAFEHFCNFAFKEKHCPEDFKRDSWRVVEYAHGNPLVLKVLGSSLKRKSHWGNVLDDLNRICESDIHDIYDILKISFNELTRKEKSMFLDIACFLEGEDKDFVTRILDDSGSHRLDVLVDKSLITVSYNCFPMHELDSRLQMHDLLQEMGREIVRQESEEEPGRRSRLWDPKEIRRVLKHNMISGKIKRLYLRQSAMEEVPSSIECLTDLEELDLRDCKRLKRISTRFCKLRSLVDLRLSACLNLERFPEILEKMEHLKYIYLDRTAITELPSSFENLPGLESLCVNDCSKLDKLPDNIGNLESLQAISAVGSAISQLPSSVADSNVLRILEFSRCKGLVSLPRSLLFGLSSLTGLHLSGNNFESLPANIKQLSQLFSLELSDCKMLQSLPELPLCLESLDLMGCNMLRSLPELPLCLKSLYLEDCNMLRSLPELPLCLRELDATNCKRLQSLPEIPSCLQELDASVLEKLSKPSPDLCKSIIQCLESQSIYFEFTNCLKLNGKANNKILADSLLRIRHMAIASLRLGYENANNEKLSELSGSLIVLPGSEIPDWFSNQSSGSSICIQLPPHSFCRNLIGFAFCAVPDFKQVYSDFHLFSVECQFDLEIKTLSDTKHVDLGYVSHLIHDIFDSDHVILGFKPCLNVGFPDGYHHTTVSLKFFNELDHYLKDYKIKRCGVCPVFANPSEIKANTFTLNFGTEVWKLDDLPSANGTAASEFDSISDEGELYCIDSSSDEEELEPSPKRTCRADQVNTP